MTVRGARIALDPHRSVRRDLHVPGSTDLDLSGYLVLPGLINAHDHLEFNLFPQLANGPYPNARTWAEDIFHPDRDPVKLHASVGKETRLLWGGLRNLLSGVTAVAHHNPYHPIFERDFPVRVVKNFGWAHSLDFTPDLVARFRATPPHWPFILHAAEGTDEHARRELAELDRLGVLTGRTILVHALGIDEPGWRLLADRGVSVVWCPTSNLALYGETLGQSAFQSEVRIALGTDSAISAQTDLFGEIAAAHRAGVPIEAVYEMVTSRPAAMLRLDDREGDFFAVRDIGQTPAEALLHSRPELVSVRGRIRLASPDLRPQAPTALYPLRVGDSEWFTDVNLPELHRRTANVLGPEYRLAGKQVSV